MYFTTGMAGGESFERLEELSWKEFFRDPSQWWDNRTTKRSPRQPDFNHKLTQEPLWMGNPRSPSWVAEELKSCGFVPHHQCIGRVPDALSPSLLRSCGELKELREPIEKNYSDAAVTMYAKCGDLQNAQALLDKHSPSSIVPWTTVIAGYAQRGKAQKAFDCLEQMQREGISPNAETYVCILKACATIGALYKGKQIHDKITKQGLLEDNVVLGNALVDMYAKCGALPQAQSVLEKLHTRDVVSWNALITGYAQMGQGQLALECFEQMQREGIFPNAVTYLCILKGCAVIGAIDKGKQIHDEILRQGLLQNNKVLGTALVDMYAKCGALLQAQSILEKLHLQDVVSWNALIAGYAQKGQGQQALKCFEQMQREGILPNEVTYMFILKGCAVIGATDKGKEIHDEILRQGLLEHNMVLGTALVDMYAKCGALPQAQSLLNKLPSRDVVCWNALIAGYVQKG